MSVLRRIFGVTCRDRRHNIDLKKELGMDRDVLMGLQQRQLTYFYVVHMGPERFSNILLYGDISGTWPRGRPRKKWINNVQEDCEWLGLSLVEADRLTEDRGNWNLVVSRAACMRWPPWCRRGIMSSQLKLVSRLSWWSALDLVYNAKIHSLHSIDVARSQLHP